jgi:hypothetical protein
MYSIPLSAAVRVLGLSEASNTRVLHVDPGGGLEGARLVRVRATCPLFFPVISFDSQTRRCRTARGQGWQTRQLEVPLLLLVVDLEMVESSSRSQVKNHIHHAICQACSRNAPRSSSIHMETRLSLTL